MEKQATIECCIAQGLETERCGTLRTIAKVLLCFSTLVGMCSCLQSSKNSLGWETVKAEIRNEFPSVDQLSTKELEDWLVQGKRTLPILLDARAPEEYAVSHLPGAVLASSEEQALERLSGVEPERPVVVYCSVGYRSSLLAEKLTQQGFSNVSNLEGSIFQWANEGRDVYRGGDEVRVVHPYDNHWGRLLFREFWSYKP